MGIIALYTLNRLVFAVCVVLMAAWCTTEYRLQSDVYGKEMLLRKNDMSDEDASRVLDSMMTTGSVKKRIQCDVAAPPLQPQ